MAKNGLVLLFSFFAWMFPGSGVYRYVNKNKTAAEKTRQIQKPIYKRKGDNHHDKNEYDQPE